MDNQSTQDPQAFGSDGDSLQGFGEHFTSSGEDRGGTRVPGSSGGRQAVAGGDQPLHGVSGKGGNGRESQAYGSRGSSNLGLQRKTGRKRVLGGATSLKPVGAEVVKSYNVSANMQFNDVEELRGDCISRSFAQEIMERLWAQWGLDTSNAEVMRKAEDMVYGLFAMRTASPDADFGIVALLGNIEVDFNDLSQILSQEEVTRRRFARAISDDIRSYVAHPDNVRLREILSTVLGVKSEYAILAFDGSTHCSGMSSNQIMFTKNLERMNLFDTQEVRDKLGSTQALATGGFQVNRGKGAFN